MKGIIENKYFDEIYSLIICLISVLCWKFSSMVGVIFLLIIGIFTLLVIKNIVYCIPLIFNMIFINNNDFVMGEIPYLMIFCGLAFFVSLIIYFIKEKPKIKLDKHAIIFLLMALSMAIPVFWNNILIGEQKALLLLYFAGFIYFSLYFLFSILPNQNYIDKLKVFASYTAILIALECIITFIIRIDKELTIVFDGYSLGWGICNEAGLLLLTFLPFLAIDFYNQTNKRGITISLIKIFIILFGLLFSCSRGAYLFGILELGLLTLLILIKTKNKKAIIIFLSTAFSIFLLFVIIKFDLICDFILSLFFDGLSSDDRLIMYQDSLNILTKSIRNFFFGSGLVSQIDLNNRFVVYHSTLFESLVLGGVIGFAILIMHFIYKYKTIMKLDNKYKAFLLIGFIVVDIYGLIDNTYYMYYYMIPLSIMLAILEKNNSKLEENI